MSSRKVLGCLRSLYTQTSRFQQTTQACNASMSAALSLQVPSLPFSSELPFAQSQVGGSRTFSGSGLSSSSSSSSPSSPSSSASESDSEYFASQAWSEITYPPPSVAVGQEAPYFSARAVVDGEFTTISLDDYEGEYVVLAFYPKDFTFVCPTEIIAFSDRAEEFEDLNCQVIMVSTDTEESHLAWTRIPRAKGGLGYMQIPLMADTTKVISARYGVLLPKLGIALRGLFIINPKGVVEQITINSLPVGRSVDETLRLLQAIQYVKEHGEVCPAGWQPGGKTMVADPEESLEYFESVASEPSAEDSFGASLTPITTKSDFNAAISGGPALIDFYAPWCGKCRQISPYLDELAKEYPDVKYFKVDTTLDAMQSVVQEQEVKALPHFKFFSGGKEVHSGVMGYKKAPLHDGVKALSEIAKK